jgi:metallo-beta-lactamase class B
MNDLLSADANDVVSILRPEFDPEHGRRASASTIMNKEEIMTLHLRSLAAVLLIGTAGCLQAQPAAPAKPDTPEIKAMIENIRESAGPMWAYAVHFWCEAPSANRPTDAEITPTKIFDNVWAIGNVGTTVYVIQTSDGLLMIDSLSADQTETQLLPGFKKAGLDPANVKIIVVAHGHADHFGGTPYFQQHFGSKVYISAIDWDMMEHPPAGQAKKKGPAVQVPKHDADLKDGVPVVLGDFKITPVAIPGHTAGAMGFIFPVKDKGQTHTAALFGGTWLLPGFVKDDAMRTFVTSLDRWKEITENAKVDVSLMNHPLMDPIQNKLDALASRKNGDPNPFVVGVAGYQKFMDVAHVCSEVDLARRKL